MPVFRLLVTDLTDYNDLRCVAGWDLDRKTMIRPEPHPAGFWSAALCGPGNAFFPGNVVQVTANTPNPPTQFPHLTEDRVVQGQPALLRTLNAAGLSSALRTIGSSNVATTFSGPVQFSNGKAFIGVGVQTPSLRGLNIDSRNIEFSEENFDGRRKPRCIVTLPNRNRINLSVTATDLKDIWNRQGVAGLQRTFAGNRDLHLRLGLARGFGRFPDRCYMQVNGIYPI